MSIMKRMSSSSMLDNAGMPSQPKHRARFALANSSRVAPDRSFAKANRPAQRLCSFSLLRHRRVDRTICPQPERAATPVPLDYATTLHVEIRQPHLHRSASLIESARNFAITTCAKPLFMWSSVIEMLFVTVTRRVAVDLLQVQALGHTRS